MIFKILLYFFAAVGVAATLVVLFGTYLWFSLDIPQYILDMTETTMSAEEEVLDSATNTPSSSESPQEEPALLTEPMTIPSSALTDEQRALVETFGLDSENLTITPEMILCAEQTLGNQRFSEILSGALPSVPESLSLLPCLRQQ